MANMNAGPFGFNWGPAWSRPAEVQSHQIQPVMDLSLVFDDASPPLLDKTSALKQVKVGVYSDHEDMPSEYRRDEDKQVLFKKVRVHKLRPQRPENIEEYNDMVDRRIAEIVPAIANLSISEAALVADQRQAASEVRVEFDNKYNPQLVKHTKLQEEIQELQGMYDLTKSLPLDDEAPDGWQQQLRPTPRDVKISWYRQNMVQYIRFIQGRNIWYYRDRMNVPRGPCPAHVLRECWVHGIIDENTLVWGQGLFDWLPMKNVRYLLPQIRTFEVRLGAWMKKTFSLKPALNWVRDNRGDYRNSDPRYQTTQVEHMR